MEKLTAENKKLKAEANNGWYVTVGEEPHRTDLKLRGDFESIKAAQAIIIERDKLRGELRNKQKALDCLYQAHSNLKKQNRELKNNQTGISERQRSNAWGEVHKTLNEVAPGWHTGNDSGMNLACATIRKLAEDAKKFRALQPCHFANRVTEVSNERGVITSVDAEIEGPVRENVFYYFPFGQPK